MSHDTDPLPTATRAGDAAVVVLIIALFRALWGLMGAAALPGASAPDVTLLVVAATAVLLLAAARLFRLSRRSPHSPEGGATNPFQTRAYRLAVLFEAVGIPAAVIVLNNAGHPGAVASAVAAIVGLHFFGLIPAFRSWRFAYVGGAMVSVALFSLLLPTGTGVTSPRNAVVGLGCALVLWVAVSPLALSAWRQAAARPR